MSKKKKHSLPLYEAYRFRDKDPAIDELRTVLEDHFGHRLKRGDLKLLHDDGGPSIACMEGWFFGATQRPQNPTLEAAGRAAGYERRWIKSKKSK